MNPFGIAKSVVELLVSAGSAAVVGNAIKASIPASSRTINKISIGVGGLVLSGMVGEMAAKYAIANIDTAVEQFKTVKNIVTEETPS